MRKVFSKFTKERVQKFQIETAIYEDNNGNRFVGKRALYPEGEMHVDRLLKNYEKNSEFFTKCEKQGDEVVFPFIIGNSYYELLMKYLHEKDKDAVMRVLEAYKELLAKLYPNTAEFESTEKFREVFGVLPENCSYSAAYGVNIDLTLDNIILFDGKPMVIDYEWVFDFPIPVKFPVYRAVFALYAKHGQILSDLIAEEEMYGYFGITVADREYFAKMNASFGEYVEGGSASYHNILKQYEKKSWDVSGLIPGQHYMQVYYDAGSGYSEANSRRYFFTANTKTVSIVLEKDVLKTCKEIRIDPVECSAMIKLVRLEIETADYIRKITEEEMRTNGKSFGDGHWLFVSDDPQIIIKMADQEKWIGLKIEFSVCGYDVKDIDVINRYYEQKILQMKKDYDANYQLLLEMQQSQIDALLQSQQLLKDKLAYIEGTKVYRKLLKGKVDALGLWHDLEL